MSIIANQFLGISLFSNESIITKFKIPAITQPRIAREQKKAERREMQMQFRIEICKIFRKKVLQDNKDFCRLHGKR